MIALAAMYDKKFCRSFPFYGAARRGAPLVAFSMIGDRDEMTRSRVYQPDIVIVLDPELPKAVNVVEGLKGDGVVIQNTRRPVEEAAAVFKTRPAKIATVDATSIAMKTLKRTIPNTTMLGAFSRVTGHVTLQSSLKAIEKRFSGALAEMNKEAAKIGYGEVKVSEVW